jgi:DNA-binding NarL/FixJ family response regulator
MTANGVLRVLVVDDHDLFRTGLRALLQAEGFVVADAPSGEEALSTLLGFQPDVVIMDMKMPGMSGLEATRRVLDEMPGVSVLMLSIDRLDESIVEALRAGASGYLAKDTPLDQIVGGIRAAAAGQFVLGRFAGLALVARLEEEASSVAEEPGALPKLSQREREVLVLLARGCDNPTIATRLFLSPSTVKHHVSRILQKLGVDNRLQAAAFAIRHGWTEEDRGNG